MKTLSKTTFTKYQWIITLLIIVTSFFGILFSITIDSSKATAFKLSIHDGVNTDANYDFLNKLAALGLSKPVYTQFSEVEDGLKKNNQAILFLSKKTFLDTIRKDDSFEAWQKHSYINLSTFIEIKTLLPVNQIPLLRHIPFLNNRYFLWNNDFSPEIYKQKPRLKLINFSINTNKPQKTVFQFYRNIEVKDTLGGKITAIKVLPVGILLEFSNPT